MPGATNFVQFNPTAANQETDANYATDTQRSGGVALDAIIPSATLNKEQYQSSTMVAALALSLVNKAFSPVDGSPSSATGLVTPSAAVTALAAVLSNILTTADYAAIASALGAGFSASLTNP